jgi:hypothetical protein
MQNNVLNIDVNSLLQIISDKDKDIKNQQDMLTKMLTFVPVLDNTKKNIKLNMPYLKFYKLQSNNNIIYWKHSKYDYHALFHRKNGLTFNIADIIINASGNNIIISKNGKIIDFPLKKYLYTSYFGLKLIINKQGFFIYKHNINIFRYNYYNKYVENNVIINNYPDIYFKLYDDIKHYCYSPYGLKIKDRKNDFFIDIIPSTELTSTTSSKINYAQLKLVHVNGIYYTTVSYNMIVKDLKINSYFLSKRINKNKYYNITIYKKGLLLNVCGNNLLIPYDKEGRYFNSNKNIMFEDFNTAMEKIEYNFDYYYNICKQT